MSAKTKVFDAFQSLSVSHSEYRGKCPAHTRAGTPCSTNLKSDYVAEVSTRVTSIASIKNGKHQQEETNYILQKIAVLTLCGRHSKDGDITAAVRQWEAEVPIAAIATPKTKGSSLVLDFKRYQIKEITDQILANPDLYVDKKISGKLLGISPTSKSCNQFLYILEHKNYKGMYKVGFTEGYKRIRDHEKCYPGLSLHGYVPCPNAELFEKIVHLEFVQYRYSHFCEHHYHEHIEWFEAPLTDIWRSVNAWTEFARGLYPSGKPLNKFHLELPGFDSGPARWHRWAKKWVEIWATGDKGLQPLSPNPAIQVDDTCNGAVVASTSMASPPISASDNHGLQSLTPPSANARPRQGRQSIGESASTLEISASKSDSGSTFSLSIKSTSAKIQYDCDSQPSTPDISPTRRLAPGRPGLISTGAGLLMEQLTGRLRSLGIRSTEQHGIEGSDLLPIE
ncbi:GIY-YIG nuclease family protein [Aspergillus stella-maris]|uniref:GIY-YIG nuclease family protein n=1 Tax=Aspergillus stella-maris TaxID=1810926 RepID=UPI003CCDEFD6